MQNKKDSKKPWNSKEWKEKRNETITDSSVCEFCGSKENLVIHHPNSINFKKIKQLVNNRVYYFFREDYSKKFPTKEEIKEHSGGKQHRHRSHDYWHELNVNHKFEIDNSGMQERSVLSKEFKEFDKLRFNELYVKFRQLNKDKIELAIEKAYADETEKYNNFEDIQIICKGCHWATHNDMDLCPICKNKYKKIKFNQCFDCLSNERKKEIEKINEESFFWRAEEESKEPCSCGSGLAYAKCCLWFWCFHCEKVFQGKNIKSYSLECPFCKAGTLDIRKWESMSLEYKLEDLYYGLDCPIEY